MAEPRRPQDEDYEEKGGITWANRAPHAKDKGLIWIVEAAGATSLYTRNRTSGTWTLIGP